MEKLELVKNFIVTVKDLPHRDKTSLENFRRQLDAAICDIYGDMSSYREDLKTICFTLRSLDGAGDNYTERWNTGIRDVIQLLENMMNEESQKETEIKLFNDQSVPPEENLSGKEEGIVPTYLPSEDGLMPNKDLGDYILELEFTPEAETINIDAMQNLEDHEPPQAPPVSPSQKTVNPPNLSESKERSKIEQLESAIEKIKKTKLRELTLPTLNDGPEIMVGVSGSLSPDQMSEIASVGTKQPQPIFITYGYNEAMKDEVVATLQRLDFQVIVREKTAAEGKTFTTNFIEFHDIGFAVVVLSGDDFGYPKDHETHQAKLRPRQQIVFELGFLAGKLGRDRVFVLHQDSKNFELPTAFFDILYVPYRKMGEWQLELLRQLKRAGYSVDANKLI